MANMSIQLKDSSNNNLYPIPPNDYIVEQGTSGMWTYRKWNSGIAECWGGGTHNVTSWGTWGNVYEASPYKQVGYPSGLFIEAPSVLNITPNGTGGITLLGYEVSTNGTKDISPVFYGLRGSTAASGTIGFCIYARGRWK